MQGCLGRIDLMYSTLVSPQPWALAVPLSPAQPYTAAVGPWQYLGISAGLGNPARRD